jgi:hypothetical protein
VGVFGFIKHKGGKVWGGRKIGFLEYALRCIFSEWFLVVEIWLDRGRWLLYVIFVSTTASMRRRD